MRLCLVLYRVSLALLPGALRARVGPRMELVVQDRLADTFATRGTLAAVWSLTLEIWDVAQTAWSHRRTPKVPGAALRLALIATTVMIGWGVTGMGDDSAATNRGWFDFHATDPAGEFTLTIRDNRAVAVTIDGVELPPHRIRQTPDSIRILHAGGDPWFGVHFDPDLGEIRWDARPTKSSPRRPPAES